MPVKKIWIVSTTPWSATLQSSQPSGETSWFSLSKTSGGANYPDGEEVEVRLTENVTFSRQGTISILSGGKTVTVSLHQKTGVYALTDEEYNAVVVDNQFLSQ